MTCNYALNNVTMVQGMLLNEGLSWSWCTIKQRYRLYNTSKLRTTHTQVNSGPRTLK